LRGQIQVALQGPALGRGEMVQAIPAQRIGEDPVVLDRIVAGLADPEGSVLQPFQGRIDISQQMLETRRPATGQGLCDSFPPRDELPAYGLVANWKRQGRFIELLHQNLPAPQPRSYLSQIWCVVD